MSYRDEEKSGWEILGGCMRSLPALVNLILLIISLIRACTLLAPSDQRYLVGVDTHSKDANLVTWYCQNDGRVYNCTSDTDETLVANLPPVVGVASNSAGELTLLFEVRGVYWLGDLSGPKTQILNVEDDVSFIDIALNRENNLIALCVIRGEAHDCLGNPRQEYSVKDDQHFVGISWYDDSNAVPKIWCRKGDSVDECEVKE